MNRIRKRQRGFAPGLTPGHGHAEWVPPATVQATAEPKTDDPIAALEETEVERVLDQTRNGAHSTEASWPVVRWMRSTLLMPLGIMVDGLALDEQMPSTMLFDIVMRPKEALEATANLEEAFEYWIARHGYRRAQRLFKWQVRRIAFFHFWDRIIERLGKIVSLVKPGL